MAQPKVKPSRLIGRDGVARLERGAFAILRAIRRGDVEHMDLAIAGDLVAGAVEDHGRIVDAVLAGDFFEDRAGMDEDAVPARQLLHGAIGRPIAEDFRGLIFVRAWPPRKSKHSGRPTQSGRSSATACSMSAEAVAIFAALSWPEFIWIRLIFMGPSSRGSRTKSNENRAR